MASRMIVFLVLSIAVMQVNSLFFKDILDYLYDEDDENDMPNNFNNINMNEPFRFGASKSSEDKPNRLIPESEIERIVEKKMLEFIQNRYFAFPWGGNIQINQHPGEKLPFEGDKTKSELPDMMEKKPEKKDEKMPELKPEV